MTAESKEGPSPAEPHIVHHRVPVLSEKGKPGETVALPAAFSTPIRPDLIHRAVVAAQARRRQPHGTSPTAGLRHSVEWSERAAASPERRASWTACAAPKRRTR